MPRHIDYDAAKPLYTIDERSFSIDETEAVLDALHAAGRPILIFVHGRGDEPTKSLRGGGIFVDAFVRGEFGNAVHKLEAQYDISVVLFNWDSRRGLALDDRTRPLANIDAAAAALARLLAQIVAYRGKYPDRRVTFLAHSMGSIVVQKCVESGDWPTIDGGVFANLILSEPDADSQEHATWLTLLGVNENVFVTFNTEDHVLLQSTNGRLAGRFALGLGPAPPLAQNGIYIDLSHMGAVPTATHDPHEVVNKRTMANQVHVCKLFSQVLGGDKALLVSGVNVEQIVDKVVYRLKFERSPESPCFASLGPTD